jgi:dihydrofolate reductase
VARLLYTFLTSLDGYIADAAGNFDWAAPDAEVHSFANDLERGVGTHLYGRRMYEVMRVWADIDPVSGRLAAGEAGGGDSAATEAGRDPAAGGVPGGDVAAGEAGGGDEAAEDQVMAEYARIWQAADKVVFSTSLAEVSTERTELRRTFDPAKVRQLVSSAGADVGIGGARLAGAALLAGLVDEIHQLVFPVIVGGGTSWLPDGLQVPLELVDERRFESGVVYLRYLLRPSEGASKG